MCAGNNFGIEQFYTWLHTINIKTQLGIFEEAFYPYQMAAYLLNFTHSVIFLVVILNEFFLNQGLRLGQWLSVQDK